MPTVAQACLFVGYAVERITTGYRRRRWRTHDIAPPRTNLLRGSHFRPSERACGTPDCNVTFVKFTWWNRPITALFRVQISGIGRDRMSIDRPTKEEMQALIDRDDFIRGRRSRDPKLAILWQCEKAGWVQAVPSGHADFVFFRLRLNSYGTKARCRISSNLESRNLANAFCSLGAHVVYHGRGRLLPFGRDGCSLGRPFGPLLRSPLRSGAFFLCLDGIGVRSPGRSKSSCCTVVLLG
jgi:hypothetical protein